MMELWPFTNFHDLNLDWIIREIKKLRKEMDDFFFDLKKYVLDLLSDHPEWIQDWMLDDGSVTIPKLAINTLYRLDNNYVIPEMFGAVGDGVTDDTTALQDAIDEASTTGAILFLLPKTYYVEYPLYFKPEVTIKGSGPKSVIYKSSDWAAGGSLTIKNRVYDFTVPAVFYHKPANASDTCGSVALKNFRIKGSPDISEVHNMAVMAPNMPYLTIEDVRTNNAITYTANEKGSIHIGNSWVVSIRDVELLNDAGYSLTMDDVINVNLSSIQSRAGTLRIRNGKAINLDANAFDNGNPSYVFIGSEVSMNGCDCETWAYALQIDSSNVSINSGRYEHHLSDGTTPVTEWIRAVNNSTVIVNGSKIEFDDYQGTGSGHLDTTATNSIITGVWSNTETDDLHCYGTSGYVQKGELRVSKTKEISNIKTFNTKADATITVTTSYRQGRVVSVRAYAQGYGSSWMIEGSLLINKGTDANPAEVAVNNITISGPEANKPTINTTIDGADVTIAIVGANVQDCYGRFEY